MADSGFLLLSLTAGLLAGGIFFGGLWWTVARVASVRSPKLFLLQSFLVRALLVLILLYFTAGEELGRFASFILGFMAARTAIMLRFRQLSPAGGRRDANESYS